MKQLIHHHDWRNQVIGSIVAVLNRDSRYEQDYVDKLKSDRVHFPQPLAAGWAVVNTGKSVAALENFLLELGNDPHQLHSMSHNTIAAIYSALHISGCHQFEATPLFTTLQSGHYFPQVVQTTEATYTAYLSFTPIG